MKRVKKSKLPFTAESIRVLSEDQLPKAAGGATSFCPTGFTCTASGCISVTCSCNQYPNCSWWGCSGNG